MGLALRAAGAGMNVFIAQFLKNGLYSEIKALKMHSGLIKIKQYGTGVFLRGTPSRSELHSTQIGLKEVRSVVSSGNHQLVVMEEANMAVLYGLISIDNLMDIINSKFHATELVITGRYAHPKIIAAADLVTEMKEVKHYYQKGVAARIGIEK